MCVGEKYVMEQQEGVSPTYTSENEEIAAVEEGSFGADMKVSLVNDGPFTIILDSEELGMA